ncbi:N-acetylgalactosamine kinase [Tribolium castaneum]|uniref:N-acetylgalactosamine kinase-like Protein n=1 Tax=Tribolium castaneum TaxID=7070 RepID=D6WIM7_TRICA|nr:PREDICTED: N-acetylgalactosamine kinase [Tribolium castaneum]EFA00753.1 N-acetylgalactosamine kinase-like Protein [Tribolium castaneum]|eukprot:XP_971902.1 PREDICTED: N-acetylgalactosamine kinase [Tribolium castaneum]
MPSENSGNVPIRELPQTDRFKEVAQLFAAHYAKKPDFYVRVPGRVNLIGEHIDYCGYGVCPMALEQDVVLAVAVDTKKSILRLHNAEKIYGDFETDLKKFSISIGDGAPDWHQYFLCGIKGIFDILPKDVDLQGMNVVVSGKIPPSAGLSSSSALVSAAALATAHAHNFPMSKEKIANLCAECERYIGTQGGGMDQAIAFLATEGCAKLIEFSPLRSTDITLPPGAVFVIAHSLAKLNKAATADFNCRVVECRLAAQLIAKKRGLNWPNIKRLGDLQKALGVDLTQMITIVQETISEELYTKEEIIGELETTSDQLSQTSLTQNTTHIQSFKLKQRALHVFREARNVEQWASFCTSPPDSTTLSKLGLLMSKSHESLRDLYECSHPQLDRLVELSRELTYGARLTGAGWGGCIVALVAPENVDKYINMLKEKFYSHLPPEQIDSVLFATSPKAGACIFQ